jgi:hypothetical protein
VIHSNQRSVFSMASTHYSLDIQVIPLISSQIRQPEKSATIVAQSQPVTSHRYQNIVLQLVQLQLVPLKVHIRNGRRQLRVSDSSPARPSASSTHAIPRKKLMHADSEPNQYHIQLVICGGICMLSPNTARVISPGKPRN